MTALITGVWKYHQVSHSPDHRAHVYVDIAHRAALMYAFAALVLAEFAARSPLSAAITYVCVAAPLVFFAIAIGAYIVHGWRRDTENQFEDPGLRTTITMYALIVAEIGGFGVLFVAVAWDMLGAS
jgi:hypothetical protein